MSLLHDRARCSKRSWASRDDPGYIRGYPPGIRENGGQYTHAATWLGCAYADLGDGERAERIFHILNPILRARSHEESEKYRVKPYVLAGDVYALRPGGSRGLDLVHGRGRGPLQALGSASPRTCRFRSKLLPHVGSDGGAYPAVTDI